MKAFISWFAQLLSDGESPSVSRLMALLCVFVCVVLPMLIWASLCISKGTVQELPGSLIGFMGAANTSVLTLFHLNKREETKVISTP